MNATDVYTFINLTLHILINESGTRNSFQVTVSMNIYSVLKRLLIAQKDRIAENRYAKKKKKKRKKERIPKKAFRDLAWGWRDLHTDGTMGCLRQVK